jgi:hypothetical protein
MPKKPAKPALELLRVETYRHRSEAEEHALQIELSDLIGDTICDMPSGCLQEVARFIDIVKHNRGCATPAEQFITKMVALHYANGGLTPDDVAREIDPGSPEGFRADFESLLDERRHFDLIYTDRQTVEAAPQESSSAGGSNV